MCPLIMATWRVPVASVGIIHGMVGCKGEE